MASFDLRTTAGALRLSSNSGTVRLGLVVGAGQAGPPGPGATQADLVAALAADPTPANAAAAAVNAKVAALAVPTTETLTDPGNDWPFAVMRQTNREVSFGMRPDKTFYPTPKVETDLYAFRVDLDPSTGWRWAIRYTSGEVAFGQRTDGTYFPDSLSGAGSTSKLGLITGDSLADGWNATLTGATGLNTTTGLSWSTESFPGQTSPQIAARQGGQPARVTITGGTIPASGSVAATLTTRLRSDSTPFPVVIQGVAGTFSATAATDGWLAGTFVRSMAGIPIPVPASSPVQTGHLKRAYPWQIFWSGRNNYASPTQVVSDLQAMYAYLAPAARERLVVFGIFPSVGEETGTGARATVDACTAAIRDAFPAQFFDAAAALRSTAMLSAVGVTPTAQDSTDIANGLTPVSFRAPSDGLHLGANGYAALNLLVPMLYRSKGWIV